MPAFNRQTSPQRSRLIEGATIGVNEDATYHIDVTEGDLSANAGAKDDTGAGDAYSKYVTVGAAFAAGRLRLRGWAIAKENGRDNLVGLNSVGDGTELSTTLYLADGHKVTGVTVVDIFRVGTAVRSRRGISLIGYFSNLSESRE